MTIEYSPQDTMIFIPWHCTDTRPILAYNAQHQVGVFPMLCDYGHIPAKRHPVRTTTANPGNIFTKDGAGDLCLIQTDTENHQSACSAHHRCWLIKFSFYQVTKIKSKGAALMCMNTSRFISELDFSQCAFSGIWKI